MRDFLRPFLELLEHSSLNTATTAEDSERERLFLQLYGSASPTYETVHLQDTETYRQWDRLIDALIAWCDEHRNTPKDEEGKSRDRILWEAFKVRIRDEELLTSSETTDLYSGMGKQLLETLYCTCQHALSDPDPSTMDKCKGSMSMLLDTPGSDIIMCLPGTFIRLEEAIRSLSLPPLEALVCETTAQLLDHYALDVAQNSLPTFKYRRGNEIHYKKYYSEELRTSVRLNPGPKDTAARPIPGEPLFASVIQNAFYPEILLSHLIDHLDPLFIQLAEILDNPAISDEAFPEKLDSLISPLEMQGLIPTILYEYGTISDETRAYTRNRDKLFDRTELIPHLRYHLFHALQPKYWNTDPIQELKITIDNETITLQYQELGGIPHIWQEDPYNENWQSFIEILEKNPERAPSILEQAQAVIGPKIFLYPPLLEWVIKQAPEQLTPHRDHLLNWLVSCETTHVILIHKLFEFGADYTAIKNQLLNQLIQNQMADVLRLVIQKERQLNPHLWRTAPFDSLLAQVLPEPGINHALITVLLTEGAPVDLMTRMPTERMDFADETSLLNWAIENNERELVEALLERGADIQENDGWDASPLHLAVRLGLITMVEVLLNHNASCTPANGHGRNVLHVAIQPEHPNLGIINLLIQKSPALIHRTDVYGLAPLDLVVRKLHELQGNRQTKNFKHFSNILTALLRVDAQQRYQSFQDSPLTSIEQLHHFFDDYRSSRRLFCSFFDSSLHHKTNAISKMEHFRLEGNPSTQEATQNYLSELFRNGLPNTFDPQEKMLLRLIFVCEKNGVPYTINLRQDRKIEFLLSSLSPHPEPQAAAPGQG